MGSYRIPGLSIGGQDPRLVSVLGIFTFVIPELRLVGLRSPFKYCEFPQRSR